jgi:hypothetical protein
LVVTGAFRFLSAFSANSAVASVWVPGEARAGLLLAKVVEWRDNSVTRVATME